MTLKALTLMAAAVLLVSPLAIGGQLKSADSQFLFGKDMVAAKTMSEQEMRETQGQKAIVHAKVVKPVNTAPPIKVP